MVIGKKRLCVSLVKEAQCPESGGLLCLPSAHAQSKVSLGPHGVPTGSLCPSHTPPLAQAVLLNALPSLQGCELLLGHVDFNVADL